MLWERLTPRQTEYAELLIQGCGQSEIAKRLGIGQSAVKHMLREIAWKAGVHDSKKLPHITVAVALTYDRYPDLLPAAPRYGRH